MLLFRSQMRFHMLYEATLTRWYGSAQFFIQENVKSRSPWLAVGSSLSHSVVFILGKVQGERLLGIVSVWVKGRGAKWGKYVLFIGELSWVDLVPLGTP